MASRDSLLARAQRRLGKPFWRELSVALAIVALGTALRLSIVVRNAETPMIDENEVVEQAVAFLGPDLNFYFLKYGPLTMYALAGIYRVAAALHGISPLDYASRVFLEGAEHYTIARVYTSGWLSVLALAAFFVLRRQLGARPAWLACALLAFPVIDVLAPGTRIDAPQAAFQCLALLALTEVLARPRWTAWLAAGACTGLAVATKPLPGLLIAPCFLLASWFAAGERPGGSARAPLARLGATFAAPGLWLAALACLICAVAGDPELLHVRKFIESQREALELHSGKVLHARSSIHDTFLLLGWPFVAAATASLLSLAVLRDRRGLVIVLFVAVYVGAFVGRASRTYFMLAPAGALCLLIGYAWARAEALLGQRPTRSCLAWGWLPLAGLLLAPPAEIHWSRSRRDNPVLDMTRWVEANVPPGTRIFHLGGRAYGRYLVAMSKKLQSHWGDHFDYGRDRYAFLRAAFDLGYQRWVESGRPRYSLEVRAERVLPRSANFNKRWITDGLVRRAREKKQKYIVLAGYRVNDVRELGYPWFDQAILEKEVRGMAIFRVPEATMPEATWPSPAPVR